MKSIDFTFKEMVSQVPAEKMEADLSFAIAERLDYLIRKHGLSKKEFATSIGKKPSEVTKWLSGNIISL